MNERISELWNKAAESTAAYPSGQNNSWETQVNFMDKFAELIVRECVEQLELVRKYRYDRVQPLENQQTIIDECQYQIKQHFGVEE